MRSSFPPGFDQCAPRVRLGLLSADGPKPGRSRVTFPQKSRLTWGSPKGDWLKSLGGQSSTERGGSLASVGLRPELGDNPDSSYRTLRTVFPE